MLTEAAEQFHSTPETQTDESYNHPEDLEHFAHHEQIEHQEAEREAKYQGVSVEEVEAQHEEHHVPEGAAPVDSEHVVQNPHDDQLPLEPPVVGGPPKITRVTPPEKQDPSVRYANEKAEGEWGAGDAGYKSPKSPSEKMRCVPSNRCDDPGLMMYVPCAFQEEPALQGTCIAFRVPCNCGRLL